MGTPARIHARCPKRERCLFPLLSSFFDSFSIDEPRTSHCNEPPQQLDGPAPLKPGFAARSATCPPKRNERHAAILRALTAGQRVNAEIIRISIMHPEHKRRLTYRFDLPDDEAILQRQNV